MKVLIGCEESQTITIEFRKLRYQAFSCDLKKSSGGHPEWHYKNDIFRIMNKYKWDLIIIHPPCTALSVSGNGTYAKGKNQYKKRLEAVIWTQKLWDNCIKVCDLVAMENPVGVLNTIGFFPKPQYIQPWEFGHGETKKTGLWLYGLPKLIPTNIVEGREQNILKMGPSPERSELRSKTYVGIAQAMAQQWGRILL